MAVTNDDLMFYLSANRPEDDSSTSGGARDPKMQLLLTANTEISGGDTLDVVSDSASDVSDLTVAGYTAAGAWVEEVITLTGTTPVTSTTEWEYVQKLELDADAVGEIAITQTSTPANVVHTIPAGERGAAKLFLKASANTSGGAAKSLYEKLFAGNGNATDALISGTLTATLNEEAHTSLTFAMGKTDGTQATGGTESVAARTTAPTGGSSYTFGTFATAVAVGDAADGNLVADEWQPVWCKLTLEAGRTPTKDTAFTLQLNGDAS